VESSSADVSSGAAVSSSGEAVTSSSVATTSSSAAAPSCPLPNLLVLVRSSDGGGTPRGQVRRYALGDDGTTTACPVLTARNTLSSRMATVGGVGGQVIVGGNGQVLALDVGYDTIAWSYAQSHADSGWPLNVFPVETVLGSHVGVVYALQEGDNDVRAFELLDPANGTRVRRFNTTTSGDPLYLGMLAYSGAAHPVTPGHLLYVRLSTWALGNVAIPVDATPSSPASYVVSLPETGSPAHVTSTRGPGTLGRMALVQDRYISNPDLAWMVNDEGTGPVVRGPLTCVDNPSPCATPLQLVHAVPDPTDADRLFVACLSPEDDDVNHVVRVSMSGTCQVVLDGFTLAEKSYVWRLNIASP
jgi:hypothetical protein